MDKWLIWCNLNSEQDRLAKLFKGNCVSIQGSTKNEDKIRLEDEWRNGKIPILITKPECFGFGMNWQHCTKMVFVGLSDSFEMYFQAVRRCWRFGQKKEVDVYVVTSEAEGAVVKNIKRKERESAVMIASMVEHTRSFVMDNIHKSVKLDRTYIPVHEIHIPEWLKSEKGE